MIFVFRCNKVKNTGIHYSVIIPIISSIHLFVCEKYAQLTPMERIVSNVDTVRILSVTGHLGQESVLVAVPLVIKRITAS